MQNSWAGFASLQDSAAASSQLQLDKKPTIPHLKIFVVLNISAFFSAIKQSKTFDFVQIAVPNMFEFALGSRLKNLYAPRKIENC